MSNRQSHSRTAEALTFLLSGHPFLSLSWAFILLLPGTRHHPITNSVKTGKTNFARQRPERNLFFSLFLFPSFPSQPVFPDYSLAYPPFPAPFSVTPPLGNPSIMFPLVLTFDFFSYVHSSLSPAPLHP